MYGILYRLRALFRRKAVEAELAEELRAHVERQAAKYVQSGMPVEEARRKAKLKFGGVEQVKEECRDARGVTFIEDTIRDVRYGLRQLGRNPGFTAVAILTLALGIGANASIFSMLDGVLLRSLPYPSPGQLYSIRENVPQLGLDLVPATGGNFLQWRRDCPAFSEMGLLEPELVGLVGVGSPRQVHGARVSASFFTMLGVRPELGRLFTTEEEVVGRNHEVILTHRLWEQEFRSDPGAVGRAIDLNGSPYTVVGVLPANFRFPEVAAAPALFEPLALSSSERRAGLDMHNFFAIGRLKSGVGPTQALAQLNAVEARIARESEGGKFNLYAVLTPLRTVIVGPAGQAIWMLVGAAAVLLLIICANLANLLLAKSAGRAHEGAVRSALGAAPLRVVRQFLSEGLILAAAGGLLGLLAGDLGLRLLVSNAPVAIPRVDEIRFDWRVVGFTLAATVAAALLSTLLPALRLARVRPVVALRSATTVAGGGKAAARLRGGLVVAQIGLSGALLACALLLVVSLNHVVEANSWMEERRVVALSVTAPPGMTAVPEAGQAAQLASKIRDDLPQRDEFFSNVRRKVMALPGVREAGFTSRLPLQGDDWGDSVQVREAPRPETEAPEGSFRFVSPGYFQAAGLPLVRGRFLNESDRGSDVSLISESIAHTLLPGRDPIGVHVRGSGFGSDGWLRVIGVVMNTHTEADKPPALTVYEPLWFSSRASEALLVRTAMDPSATAAAVREAVSSVSPMAAISSAQTLETIVEASEAPRRYETSLGALFAGCALFLAAVGLYGVISYSVSQRTHEIGIRMALGARHGDVLKMVIGQGLKLAIIGAAVGIAGALALTHVSSSILYGVRPSDPLTFAAVAVILLGVALLACYIPARRAMRVDPAVALRHE